jgi:hypothetical protein
MPRDIDLRKLQAFGSEIVDMLAQEPDRVYVALAEGKVMVLDRLLVKHVLRCAQPILPSVSGVTLQKQKLFLLPHESSLRCPIVTITCALCLQCTPVPRASSRMSSQPLGRRTFTALCDLPSRGEFLRQARQQQAVGRCHRPHLQLRCGRRLQRRCSSVGRQPD